jgi:glutamine amidotransferase
MKIGIVDYGMGNLHSVHNALFHLGFDADLVSTPKELANCERLILPGVGAFAQAMANLHALNLVESIKSFAQSGRPLLGVCLGMQLLASEGFEYGRTEGLGIIKGKVVTLDTQGRRLPHVGWNSVAIQKPHPLFKTQTKKADFYFVHSYHFVTEDPADALTTTEYGENFISSVSRDNAAGVQFHPEKSQEHGLRLLEAFCMWSV